MIIRYTIISLKYTVFHNISCVIGEKIIRKNSTNIKYTIFKYEIDAGDIKYIKIHKINQE